MFAYNILLLLLPFLTSVLGDKPHIALKYGDDLTSYIMISPDMSPLEEELSICSWIKQLSPTSRNGGWIHYRTEERGDEITLSDNLGWAYIMNTQTPRGQTPVHSQWYHVCLTWAYSSRKNTLYYNGVQIGTATTASGKKFSAPTGSIVFGQYHSTYKMEVNFASGYSFGGEMTKLNILKRELTSQEVAEMYKSGICSSYEESLKDDIHLSWEALLSDDTEKHGNIAKLSLTCPAHTHQPTTAIPTTAIPTTAEPTEESERGCNNRWAVLRLPDFYNQEIETDLLQDLRDIWELLAEFIGHQIDEALLAHLIKHHCGTEAETPKTAEEEETDGCHNRWAILRSSDFFDNEVTNELIKDLRGRWELLAEFEGHVIDDGLIAHLQKHHCTSTAE